MAQVSLLLAADRNCERPRFTRAINDAADPHRDYRLEELLKISPALGRTICIFHGGIEIADMGVGLAEMGKTFFQHHVTLKFVEFVEYDRTWRIQTAISIDLADGFFGVAMPPAGAGANAIKDDFVTSPIFSKYARLGFADGGELVIVWLKKRSLCVANQKNASHLSPKETASPI
jgi:hypothetical protein